MKNIFVRKSRDKDGDERVVVLDETTRAQILRTCRFVMKADGGAASVDARQVEAALQDG